MHLVHLEISNFRSIKNLDLDLKHGANLLVGPNAVGKSTVLEAIRLAKAVLAPRTQNETRQVLAVLGALSPTQQMNFGSIAGDSNRPIKINCTYELTDDEIRGLPELTKALAQSLVAAQQGIDLNLQNGELNMVQFLSTPIGRKMQSEALMAVQEPIAKFLRDKKCRLFLTMESNGGFRGEDSMSQLLFSVSERRLPPGKALFSYFPADRALNVGDAQIQIGAGDAQQQLESHNSQPALKYQRLKNVIFSTILTGSEAAQQQEEIFRKIFSNLLKEKSLGPAVVNKFGQATVMINDLVPNQSFDIDSMSSGEKGLILTFLLIARSIQESGVILLDEPELHLNSGVCRNLLDFLLDEFCLKDKIQVVLCTHSPEIMSAALRRDDCNVFYMRRDSPASLIRSSDHVEAAQALRQLGVSEIEALLFDAVIFVEGPDDVELLEYAFRDFLSRLKFKDLIGRGEIEKYIKLLGEADRQGKAENTNLFIFDRDNKPTSLQSTKRVKLAQWGRYCLENYLLEPEILYDTVRDDLKAKQWPKTFGDAKELFASMAKRQLTGRIIEKSFKELGLQDVRLRTEDKKEGFEQSAISLFSKLKKLHDQIDMKDEKTWIADFTTRCKSRLEAEESEWTSNWIDNCNGKQFLLDVYTHASPKVDIATFKRSLLTAHKFRSSQSWELLRAQVEKLVGQL
jgi:predicted ATP-dependent endonuclease of OLD family